MLALSPRVRVFVAREVVDFRRGFDSLHALVRDGFGDDPLSGHLFLFFNRARDRLGDNANGADQPVQRDVARRKQATRGGFRGRRRRRIFVVFDVTRSRAVIVIEVRATINQRES